MQYEASMTVYKGRTAIQRKVAKWLSFQKNVSQNDYIHTKDEVFMTTYLNRRA